MTVKSINILKYFHIGWWRDAALSSRSPLTLHPRPYSLFPRTPESHIPCLDPPNKQLLSTITRYLQDPTQMKYMWLAWNLGDWSWRPYLTYPGFSLLHLWNGAKIISNDPFSSILGFHNLETSEHFPYFILEVFGVLWKEEK